MPKGPAHNISSILSHSFNHTKYTLIKQLKTNASRLVLMASTITMLNNGCKKEELQTKDNGQSVAAASQSDDLNADKFDASVAVSWANMQTNLSKTTVGFDPGATGRTYAYSGLALYEAVQAGIPGYQSLAAQLSSGLALPAADPGLSYYWPVAANASMASILKSLFANTSAANMTSIDSLEADYNSKFAPAITPQKLQRSIDFGKAIATAIFEWSKTDGGHEAYLHAVDPTYVAPTGPGLWIPAPPFFSPPVRPHWGDNRSFVSGIADAAAMPPPVVYSEVPGSPFYKMANQVYKISQSLTHDDTITVKFWADLPGQLNGPSHFTNVLTQLVVKENFNLAQAAIAYAKHGIANYDGAIACFRTKYTYNQIRPVSYIQNVLGHTTWLPVIGTPPHPEYTAAHACIMQTCADVLKEIFGEDYSFDDHTHDALYGTRHYDSFDAYAQEGAWSRVLAGIHYKPSVIAGLVQGRKVARRVNDLKFKN
ncbi:MAG: vanadium-dependent haloperoxidase [Panacibacter sp.]